MTAPHFVRVGERGSEQPLLEGEDGSLFDLEPLLGDGDLDGAFFAANGIERALEAHAGGRLRELPAVSGRVGAPIARPGAVICIGQNYAAHAAESGSEPPTQPIMLLKHPGTVTGPFDDVPIPRSSEHTDWEVELGVVIGRTCRYLDSPQAAMANIVGYTISNDVSERAFQIERSGGQWSKGKCCESFNPLGPWLIAATEVAEPQLLGLRSWVNGEARQNSSTADMIFSVGYLVWHLSQFLVLEPGDLINTGTPEGVALSGRFPYLRAGDMMTLEVDGLGRQSQRLVAAR